MSKKKRCKSTSEEVGTIASKVLRNNKYSAKIKKLAVFISY